MTHPPRRFQELLDTFALMGDRQDRIDLLIETADRFAPVPASIAAPPYPEAHRVPQCESQAFVFTELRPDGTLKYHFAVENPQGVSAMALAAILDETLSGADPQEVLAIDPSFIYDLFGRELSMGKSAGLTSMVGLLQALTRRRIGARREAEAGNGATP